MFATHFDEPDDLSPGECSRRRVVKCVEWAASLGFLSMYLGYARSSSLMLSCCLFSAK